MTWTGGSPGHDQLTDHNERPGRPRPGAVGCDAQTAASQGLAAARVQNATAAQGTTGAQHVLDQLGRGPLINTRIDTRRGADAASIRVSGEASAVIPFLHLAVHAEAAGPVERFVPDLPAAGR